MEDLDKLWKDKKAQRKYGVILQDIRGNKVFISKEFLYFGDKGVEFDKRFFECLPPNKGIKYCPEEYANKLQDYINKLIEDVDKLVIASREDVKVSLKNIKLRNSDVMLSILYVFSVIFSVIANYYDIHNSPLTTSYVAAAFISAVIIFLYLLDDITKNKYRHQALWILGFIFLYLFVTPVFIVKRIKIFNRSTSKDHL